MEFSLALDRQLQGKYIFVYMLKREREEREKRSSNRCVFTAAEIKKLESVSLEL